MKENPFARAVIVSLAAMVFAGLAAGCGTGQATAASREVVTLKYPETPGTINYLRVATERGFAKEENLVLEPSGSVTGGPQAIQAIAGGSIDIGTSTNAIPLINARNTGIKIKFIAVANTTDKYDENKQPTIGDGLIVREGEVRSPKDLVGKRIGVNTLGAQAEFTIKKWLRTENVPFDKVELVVVPQANYQQVFKQKQVDALYANRANYELLKESGEKVGIVLEQDLLGGNFGTWGLFVSDGLIAKKPDVVRRFLRAYVKAWDWSRDNLFEYRKLADKLAREEGGNPGLVKYTYANGRDHALLVEDDSKFWVNELVVNGKIPEGSVNVSELWTNEFNPYYKP